jgi:hypothetical protein
MESWGEFKTVVTSLAQARGIASLAFRGVGDSGYSLVSTLDRVYEASDATERSVIAEALLKEFSRRAEHFGLRSGLSDHAVLAVGQHWGLPTRLLDWTWSPYIGAYFAFSSYSHRPGRPTETVAIWQLDAGNGYFSRRRDVGSPAVELHSADPELTPRLFAQRGLFTINHRGGDMAEALPDDQEMLIKYILPGSEYRTALDDLAWMGIDDASMFPDLSGAARAAIATVMATGSTR